MESAYRHKILGEMDEVIRRQKQEPNSTIDGLPRWVLNGFTDAQLNQVLEFIESFDC